MIKSINLMKARELKTEEGAQMENENLFYTRLKNLVNKSNKSFNQIERELGYTRNALHNYKYGMKPSAIRLLEISEYFGVTPEYLFGRSNVPKCKEVEEIFLKFDAAQKKEMFLLCEMWLFTFIDRLEVQ